MKTQNLLVNSLVMWSPQANSWPYMLVYLDKNWCIFLATPFSVLFSFFLQENDDFQNGKLLLYIYLLFKYVVLNFLLHVYYKKKDNFIIHSNLNYIKKLLPSVCMWIIPSLPAIGFKIQISGFPHMIPNFREQELLPAPKKVDWAIPEVELSKSIKI